MSWFNMWDDLKNKTCRYLLQRYLGQFLDEQLNIEQLKVDLYDGKATINNVTLRVEALNELIEVQNWPVEFTYGYVGQLTVIVPWNTLMTSDSCIEATDVRLGLRPVKRHYDCTSSMLESMWSSVSSSLQLAEEFMKQDENNEKFSISNNIIGLEKFAETIDNVLNRIKAQISNIEVAVDYPILCGTRNVTLLFHLDELNYENETLNAQMTMPNAKTDRHEKNEGTFNILSTYAKHNVTINGIEIFIKESVSTDIKSACHFWNSKNEQLLPVICIKNKQNVSVKVKQLEEIPGPKVSFDIELGSIYFFASPQQIYVLLSFLKAFTSNYCTGDDHKSKVIPQEESSVNNEYLYQLSQRTSAFINNRKWQKDELPHNESNSIKINSAMSDIGSNSSYSMTTNSSKHIVSQVYADFSVEISNFIIHIGNFVGIILYEDILNHFTTIDEEILYDADELQDYLNTSKKFFSKVSTDNYENLNTDIFCNKNHLLLRLYPICVDGKQHRNRDELQLDSTISVSIFQIFEVIDMEAQQIITFKMPEQSSDIFCKQPDLRSHVMTTNNILYKENSSVYVEIDLKKSIIELDISIYDRLSAFIGKFRFRDSCNYIKRRKNSGTSNFCKSQINVNCSELTYKIRFPIIDGRFPLIPGAVPWWHKNITEDYFLVNINQFKLQITENMTELTFSDLAAFYCDEPKFPKTQFLKCCSKKDESDNSYKNPRIVIESLDTRIKSYEETNNPLKPFSSKRSCRQTNSFSHINQDQDETETMLFPGETSEIEQFRSATLATSKLKILLNFPIVEFFLSSKKLYEIIYNRINNNLLMWEPCSPHFLSCESKDTKLKSDSQTLANVSLIDSVYVSTMSHDTDIESEIETETETSNSVLDEDFNYTGSIGGHNDTYLKLNNCDDDSYLNKLINFDCPTHKCSTKLANQQKETKLSKICFDICIAEVNLSFHVEVRNLEDESTTQCFGKFLFIIEKLKIFSVNGFRSDNNLAYLCAQISNAQVYHNGCLKDIIADNFENNFHIEEYMQATLYKLPKDFSKIPKTEDHSREMVSVVLEIEKNPLRKIKRLKLTTGLMKSILRYYPSPSDYTWIKELLDFLDVTDYPIEGYEPFHLVTEMQLHLWNCAIDFRPENFPYRAVVEIVYFSVNSNIVSSVEGCNLRFIMEECLLSLAPYDFINENYPIYKITYMPNSDLIPVLDIELLDISLRLSDSTSAKFPKFDLRCLMHDVHMRTCYDSASALAQFINYVVNYPDHIQNKKPKDTSSLNKSLHVNSSDRNTEISKEYQERLNTLMAEALEETHSNDGMKDGCQTCSDSEIYPDCHKERGIMKIFRTAASNNDVCAELGKVIDVRKSRSDRDLAFLHDFDEDYCIIGKDDKDILVDEKIKVSNGPLNIVDNHFGIPTINDKLLSAPENFPVPENRITLCEMTFTWHLYGGVDFSKPVPKKQSNISKPSNMSTAYHQGVSYSKGADSKRCEHKVKEKVTWKTRGGPDRNLEVLVEVQFTKVRFTRELYPSHTTIAIRQVLMVHEIEVRDRLLTSEINKLLYSSNKDFSNKSLHYMVNIKALHVRPNPNISDLQECSLRISLSPIRLHIDQDTLEFLSNFVLNLSKDSDEAKSSKTSLQNQTQVEHTGKNCQNPTIAVNQSTKISNVEAETILKQVNNSENVCQSLEDKIPMDIIVSKIKCNSAPTYFRELIFSPEISICFDYHGRRVEFSKGPITGLLMGLGQLQCSRIFLRKIVYRRGLLGFEKLVNFMCKEWVRDIKRNQLPKILSGIGPTYALVQLLQGIFDLFWLPFEYYQKDGRVIRGMQLGAQSFSARTILAAIELTSRIIQLLQFTAETAFDIVSPGSSLQRLKHMRKEKKRPKRPKDIREGVVNAYQIVKEGINDSAHNLIETAIIEHDQKGLSGAVGAVIRQVPQLVVCPAVLATQATTNILGGVKNSLVPEAEVESKKKWKDDNY